MSDPTDWLRERFVVVDVEGNGQQPPDLVEVAIVVVDNGVMKPPPHHWLLRPDNSITPIVTRIHGITNEMVANAPVFEDVSASVQSALGTSYFVAHGAHVDVAAIGRKLPGWAPRGVIDTLKLARVLLPGRKSYSLSALIKALAIDPGGREMDVGRAHRALHDALATAQLFMRFASTEEGTPRTIDWLMAPSPAPPRQPPAQGELF